MLSFQCFSAQPLNMWRPGLGTSGARLRKLAAELKEQAEHEKRGEASHPLTKALNRKSLNGGGGRRGRFCPPFPRQAEVECRRVVRSS